MSEKVNWVRSNIKDKKGASVIFNDLSEIAWLLNLRSSEIPHNPFFKSVLRIDADSGTLFLPQRHPELHNNAIRSFLSKENITIK
jgi:Xaa-Pro aminopeptidase